MGILTNWFLVATVGRLILGSTAVIDKLLLKKDYPNPLGYTFWLGILGLSTLLLIPIGFTLIPIEIVFLALIAGAIFSFALLFQFIALFEGEASKVLIFIGALSPIFTYTFSNAVLGDSFSPFEFTAFITLIAGGMILFMVEDERLRKRIYPLAVLSALLFGLSSTLAKSVFLNADFITGFVWMRVGGALAVLALLFFKSCREKIIRPPAHEKPKNKIFYIANRAFAGLGSLAIAYAILLGSPSLVEATTNVQYVFVALGGWLILKEKFRGRELFGKISAIAIISAGILILGIGNYLKTNPPNLTRPILWGVTFSQKFSSYLDLDWRENYRAILDDLGAKDLRLIAYWDLVEPENNKFDFADLDYQMQLAEEHGARVILAVGQKVPRWPECHFPSWTYNVSDRKLSDEILEFIAATVERYKGSPALRYWQVENEIFLPFGVCPLLQRSLFDEEIALVKRLDPEHGVLTTSSGELSVWFPEAARGDVFGTTIYRRVQNRIFGEIEYPLPPEFFRLKERFSRIITGRYDQKYIVVELAAEPWLGVPAKEAPIEEQFRVFNIAFFGDTIDYAKIAGFDEYYLWGAEWWWWLKEKHNYPEFWKYGKGIITSTP